MLIAVMKFNNNSSFNLNDRITGACDSNEEAGDPENYAFFPTEFIE